MSGRAVERHEIEAAVEARRELGADYEDAVVDSLVEKIEARLAERERARRRPRRHGSDLPLVLGSLGIAIPLIGAAGGLAGLAGVIAVCAAIVLVNLLATLRG